MTASSQHPPYVLDNSVISTLYQAQALSTVLDLWPGQWIVPLEVKAEAAAWKPNGARVGKALDELCSGCVALYAQIDPRLEGTLFARLNRTLGQGEAATIAIAYHRRLGAALDDYAARRACNRLVPVVPWISTEGILKRAVTESLLTLAEAREIWAATNINDPRRQLT